MATEITLDMSEFFGGEAPFEEEWKVGKDGYIPIDDILDKKVNVLAIKDFTNDKGAGVYVLLDVDGQPRYICTHAQALVKGFNDPMARASLPVPGLTCTIEKRKSRVSDRMVYAFKA